MAAERYFHPMSKSYPVIYAYEQKALADSRDSFLYIGYTVQDVHDHFVHNYTGNCSEFRNILVKGEMNASGSVLTDDQIKSYLIHLK